MPQHAASRRSRMTTPLRPAALTTTIAAVAAAAAAASALLPNTLTATAAPATARPQALRSLQGEACFDKATYTWGADDGSDADMRQGTFHDPLVLGVHTTTNDFPKEINDDWGRLIHVRATDVALYFPALLPAPDRSARACGRPDIVVVLDVMWMSDGSAGLYLRLELFSQAQGEWIAASGAPTLCTANADCSLTITGATLDADAITETDSGSDTVDFRIAVASTPGTPPGPVALVFDSAHVKLQVCSDTGDTHLPCDGRFIDSDNAATPFPPAPQAWSVEAVLELLRGIQVVQLRHFARDSGARHDMATGTGTAAPQPRGLMNTAYEPGDPLRYAYANIAEWGYGLVAQIARVFEGLDTMSDTIASIHAQLDVLRALQQDADSFAHGLFFFAYKQSPGVAPYKDPTDDNLACGDTALLWTSLNIVRGWLAAECSNSAAAAAALAQSVMDGISFDLCYDSVTHTIALTLRPDGSRTPDRWDTWADEGGIVATVLLATGTITEQQFDLVFAGMNTEPATWQGHSVRHAAWFNAAFTLLQRVLAGFPQDGDDPRAAQHGRDTYVPTLSAYLTLCDRLGLEVCAFSDAMTQRWRDTNAPMVRAYYPPNIAGQSTFTAETRHQPDAVAPHALFAFAAALTTMPPAERDRYAAMVERLRSDPSEVFHGPSGHGDAASSPHYGFEAVVPPVWSDEGFLGAADGRPVFETLNAAYISVVIHYARSGAADDAALAVEGARSNRTLAGFALMNPEWRRAVNKALDTAYPVPGAEGGAALPGSVLPSDGVACVVTQPIGGSSGNDSGSGGDGSDSGSSGGSGSSGSSGSGSGSGNSGSSGSSSGSGGEGSGGEGSGGEGSESGSGGGSGSTDNSSSGDGSGTASTGIGDNCEEDSDDYASATDRARTQLSVTAIAIVVAGAAVGTAAL